MSRNSGPWYHTKQKSNSAAANTIAETIIQGRIGFCAVIDQLHARATGSITANNVFATATDGINSSILIAGSSNLAGAASYAHAKMEGGPRRFAEGTNVSISLFGNGDATTVGYTVDYHYEPIFTGFTGAQP
jgi:hypothetical protein